MEKPQKVEEDIDRFCVYECPRCHQSYCSNCNPANTVDFEVEDAPEGWNEKPIQWKNWEVCPWCYNQLIDIVEREKNQLKKTLLK